MNNDGDAALSARSNDSPAPVAGSDFYYASLYFAPAVRHEIHVLEALRREICRIPETCSDRGVAHIKLAWWRDEISCLGSRTPGHRLARELGLLLPRRPALRAAYLELIDGLDVSLGTAAYATDAAITSALNTTHGAVIDAIAECDTPCPAAERAVVRELAVCLELAYAVRNLRQHRRGGPLLLSRERLARHGLSVEQVRYASRSAGLHGMLHESLTMLHMAIEQLLGGMSRDLRRRQRLFTTLARIQARALPLTIADGCALIERRIELTPVHKLLIAWRVRWRG